MNKHQVSLKEYLIPKIQAIFPEFELFNIPFTSQEHLDIEGIESFVVQLDSLNQLKVFFHPNSTIPIVDYVLQFFGLSDVSSAKKFIIDKIGEENFDERCKASFFHENLPVPYEESIIKHLDHVVDFLLSGDEYSESQKDVFKIESKIMKAASQDIVIEPAIITYSGNPIIKKNTINLIQGQYGSFKSRLASFFISMMIGKKVGGTLGFEKNPDLDVLACLVDTERNNTEELPYAIQNISHLTGVKFPNNNVFRCTSLKLIDRKSRLDSLKIFIDRLRKLNHKHIYLSLDVATDTILDFNSIEESMSLLDFLGELVEEKDITVMLVIHENPGTRKARGHLGSEAWNKVSAAFRIGVLRNKEGSESNMIELEFLKLRASKKLPKIYLKFCEKTFDFELATKFEVDAAKLVSEQKANIDEVINEIEGHFEDSGQKVDQQTLINVLKEHYVASKGTITTRLKSIVDAGSELVDSDGVACFLKCHSNKGSATFYTLEPKLSLDLEK